MSPTSVLQHHPHQQAFCRVYCRSALRAFVTHCHDVTCGVGCRWRVCFTCHTPKVVLKKSPRNALSIRLSSDNCGCAACDLSLWPLTRTNYPLVLCTRTYVVLATCVAYRLSRTHFIGGPQSCHHAWVPNSEQIFGNCSLTRCTTPYQRHSSSKSRGHGKRRHGHPPCTQRRASSP